MPTVIARATGIDKKTAFKNHFIEILTGEGKSILLGATSTLLSLIGIEVDVVCYSEYLS
jgi:preprotein translocase subunit SecA